LLAFNSCTILVARFSWAYSSTVP